MTFLCRSERRMGNRFPAINVHETASKYLVNVDLPGIKKEKKDGKLIRQARHMGS